MGGHIHRRKRWGECVCVRKKRRQITDKPFNYQGSVPREHSVKSPWMSAETGRLRAQTQSIQETQRGETIHTRTRTKTKIRIRGEGPTDTSIIKNAKRTDGIRISHSQTYLGTENLLRTDEANYQTGDVDHSSVPSPVKESHANAILVQG